MKWLLLLLLFAAQGTCSTLEKAKHLVDLGSYNSAILLYQQCLTSSQNPEEIWFAKYMLGTCYEDQGAWDEALFWYLQAYQSDAKRPEPIQKIATHYRITGQHHLAYLFAKYGSLLPSAKASYFEDPLYADYKFDEELSIVAYYTPFVDQGFDAVNNLMIQKNIPWKSRDLAFKNALFYVKTLPKTRSLEIDIELPMTTSGEPYHPMNPSICKTENGYHVICRAVNYSQKGARDFTSHDLDGIIRTRNFLLEYDKDFALLSKVELEDVGDSGGWVRGQEDCRLFRYRDACWFTCTIPNRPTTIALGKLDPAKESIQELTPLIGPDPNRCEKNWLPFVQNGELRVIYSSDPFRIYKVDMETGAIELSLEYDPGYDFSCFRGSASPICFDEGYLMLVHEAVVLDEGFRNYLHRFVFLDTKFHIKKISKPFIFDHLGIEFCLAMTLNHTRDELILGVGIEDSQAKLIFVDLESVRDLLEELGS